MQQLELITIENPCINVCQTDNRGYCLGCFRSRDERYNWANMTPEQKRRVLELCKARNKRRQAKKKTQHTNPPQTTKPEIASKESNTAVDDQPSCVTKTDQSVQDMGLDLFDL